MGDEYLILLRSSIGIFFLLLFFSGCTMKEQMLFQTKDGNTTATKVSDKEYKEEMVFENKIAPSDRVSIMIYKQSQAADSLSSMMANGANTRTDAQKGEQLGMLVASDGTIHLPLIGIQKISGMTEQEASQMLTEKLELYLRSPYVTVEILNQRVFVLGEVNQPGVVPVLNGTMNIVEAIARCKDFTMYADPRKIKVVRGDLRHPEVRIINLTQMEAIEMSSLFLRPNDIVYVIPREIKGFNIAMKEFMPPFQTISSMLQPFVNIKYLSE